MSGLMSAPANVGGAIDCGGLCRTVLKSEVEIDGGQLSEGSLDARDY